MGLAERRKRVNFKIMEKLYAFKTKLAILLISVVMILGGVMTAGADNHNGHESRYQAELDQLFSTLSESETLEEANAIITNIWQIWRTDTEDSVNIQMMRRGIGFMEQGDYINAEAMFTRIINRDNGFMEAWNKRATIRFMRGNLQGSVDDINEVLKLEPRHFGALSGLGMINIQRGDLQSALQNYQDILAINPLSPDANSLTLEIKLKLRGDPA